MKLERHIQADITRLDISSDFIMPKKPQWDVVNLLNYDSETAQALSTDISHINIPIDPKQESYQTIWELLTTNKLPLSRTFNISLWKLRSKEVLISLFSLDIDYSKLWNISYWDVFKTTKKYPHPKTLNKNTSPEVRKQIQKITSHTLKWYEWKSIEELLSWTLPTQTFWDFAIACLKAWIKLSP